jgi:hypothetical protein
MYTCRSHGKNDCRDAVCRRQAERAGQISPAPSKARAQQLLTVDGLIVAGPWAGYEVLPDGRRGSLAHLSDCTHLVDSALEQHDVIPADRAVEAIRELRKGAAVEARDRRIAVRLCQTCDARLA